MAEKVKIECYMDAQTVKLLDEWAERAFTTRAALIRQAIFYCMNMELDRRANERKERLFKGVPDVVLEP